MKTKVSKVRNKQTGQVFDVIPGSLLPDFFEEVRDENIIVGEPQVGYEIVETQKEAEEKGKEETEEKTESKSVKKTTKKVTKKVTKKQKKGGKNDANKTK